MTTAPETSRPSAAGPATLSVQLYSLRDALAQDQPGALERLAATGLRWVEPFGLGAADPDGAADSLERTRRLRRDLDAAGLRASSAHATFPDDLDRLVDELGALGTSTVFLPVPSAVPGTAREALGRRDSLERLADRLAAAAAELAGHGITAGYHNHWWEWADVEGRPGYDRFVERCGPGVAVELDAYWVLQGGQDPVALARSLGERVVALHVKDGPAPTGPLTSEAAGVLDQVPLGEGALDLDALLGAAAARWHVLEVDHTTMDVHELLSRNVRTCLDLGRSQL